MSSSQGQGSRHGRGALRLAPASVGGRLQARQTRAQWHRIECNGRTRMSASNASIIAASAAGTVGGRLRLRGDAGKRLGRAPAATPPQRP